MKTNKQLLSVNCGFDVDYEMENNGVLVEMKDALNAMDALKEEFRQVINDRIEEVGYDAVIIGRQLRIKELNNLLKKLK